MPNRFLRKVGFITGSTLKNYQCRIKLTLTSHGLIF